MSFPSGMKLIRARMQWDRGRGDIVLDRYAMVDSGAAISAISDTTAASLFAAGLRPSDVNVNIALAAEANRDIIVTQGYALPGATVTTLFGQRTLDGFFLVIPGLHLDIIIGLDALALAHIVVDASTDSIWHLNDIYKRAAMLPIPIPTTPAGSRTRVSTPAGERDTTIPLEDSVTKSSDAFSINAISIRDLLATSPDDDDVPDEPVSELDGNAKDAESDTRIQALVEKFKRIFGKIIEKPPHRGAYDGEMLVIDPNDPPPRMGNRIHSEKDCADMDIVVDKWLGMTMIQAGNSPWAAPAGFAGRPKKDTTRRPVFDFRGANDRQILFAYPTPLIHHLILQTRGARVRSILDCSSAYNQLLLKPGHEKFNAFICHRGIFEAFMCMLGSKNSGCFWQRFVDAMLRGDPDALPRWPDSHPRHAETEANYARFQAHPEQLTDITSFAQAYSDDIQIFSPTMEAHYDHLAATLERLDLYSVRINEFNKFGATQVKFLGFLVGKDTVEMLPDRVAAIADWPEPTTIKELQRFLGILQYYRAHIPNASKWTAKLTPLTNGAPDPRKPSTKISFTEDERDSFHRLRAIIEENLRLTIPDTSLPFILATDASKYALAGALLQPDATGAELNVVSYYSRQTTSAESRAGQFKLEVYALTACAKHWRHLLQGRHTIAYTDCEPIVNGDILTMPREVVDDPSGKLLRQILSVQDLEIDLRHHAATTHLAQHVDDISRRPDYVSAAPKDFRAYVRDIQRTHDMNPHLDTPIPTFAILVDAGTSHDDLTQRTPEDESIQLCGIVPRSSLNFRATLASISLLPTDLLHDRIRTGMQNAPQASRANLTYDRGFWRHTGRIVVPDDEELRHELIRLAHEPGHRGITATCRILAEQYWWPTMMIDTRNYITRCSTCARQKPKQAREYAGSTPRPPPTNAFDTISMDFIPNLPDNDTHQGVVSRVLTVVDEYSTYGIFVAISNNITADEFLQIFIERVYPRIGMPRLIRTDNDTLWRTVESGHRSPLWKAFCKQAGIDPQKSPPFRHESNGHAERANQTIESILRCLIDAAEPNAWARHLPIAERIYNSTPHNITGLSPDVVAFHRDFRKGFGLDDTPATTDIGDFNDIAKRIDARVADFANRAFAERAARDTRGLPTHRVGAWVLLSTSNLKITGLSSDHRLRPRFIGPYRVKHRHGIRQYELDLPPGTRIMNKFDVDRLREYHGPPPEDRYTNIILNAEGTEEIEYEIERILRLSGRRDADGRVTKTHALIKWAGYDESWNEWILLSELVKDAPEVLRTYLDSLTSYPRLEPTVTDHLAQPALSPSE